MWQLMGKVIFVSAVHCFMYYNLVRPLCFAKISEKHVIFAYFSMPYDK